VLNYPNRKSIIRPQNMSTASPSEGHDSSLADDLGLYDFPRLKDDGSDYVVWKRRAQRVLKLMGLWGIVNGDVPMPDPSAPPDERDEWSSKDEEAHNHIALTLENEPLNYVLDATSAKDCWDKLSVWYKSKWEPQIGCLVDKVFRSKLSDSEPLGPQIDALLWAAFIITSLGLALDDKVVAHAIISSLPPSLSTLQTIILCTTEASELSTEHVRSQVTFDENRRVSASGLGATAFFAKAAKKGKRSRGHPKTGSSEGRHGR
jgi:hypothetical protein